MINLKEKDREIEIKTIDGKILVGHILFHYEDSGYNLVFYVVEDQIFVQKTLEDGTLEDLLEDEYAVAEDILESYFKENQLVDENEDVDLDLDLEKEEK